MFVNWSLRIYSTGIRYVYLHFSQGLLLYLIDKGSQTPSLRHHKELDGKVQ